MPSPIAIPFLSELIRFDSVSKNSNVAISLYVEKKLRTLGFETETTQYKDTHGVLKSNVVGRICGSGNSFRRGLAYFCHTDVVPAERWFSEQHSPFEPTVVGDRLYGRGSCDMKGSLACFLTAAEQLDLQSLQAPLTIVCTADEEVGFQGVQNLIENSPFYRDLIQQNPYSIIGEPTEMEVVHAHKGAAILRVVSRGKASHSSTTEGLNANLAMIPFLAEMKAIHDMTLADSEFQNDQFDPPVLSWNIGINDHNPGVNITADQSVCTVMFRPMPGVSVEPLLERVEQTANQLGLQFEWLCHAGAVWIDAESDFVTTMLALTGKAVPQRVCYGTDGSFLSALSDKIVCGPGNIEQAHSDNEFITLEQLETGTRLFGTMIEHFCNTQLKAQL